MTGLVRTLKVSQRPATQNPDDYVKALVDGFPPLTAGQRSRLAVIIGRPAAISQSTPRLRGTKEVDDGPHAA